MDINIQEILMQLGTILSGVGIGWLSKSGRIKEKADAYKKMGEAYQYRIDTLHKDIDTCNKTIKELQERIAELNHSLNEKEDEKRAMKEASEKEIQDKKMQIRKLTEQMWQAEQEVNKAKDEIIRLTEERDHLEAVKCIRTDCKDPRGPKPPRKNQKVATDNEKTTEGS